LLRIDPELHERLRQQAVALHISLNALCEQVLTQYIMQFSANEAAQVAQRACGTSELGALLDGWGDDLLGAVLFGSAARGELRAASDIDLLLVLDASTPLHRQLYRRWDQRIAEHDQRGVALPREVNAHFVHLPQCIDQAGSLWLEVAIEGHLLRDRDGLVRQSLLALRRAIASGHFVRDTAHGQPFWRRAA